MSPRRALFAVAMSRCVNFGEAMGPVRELPHAALDDEALDLIHATLVQIAEKVEATRQGRVWDVWIDERPFHVEADAQSMEIRIAAGCNQPEDHQLLRRVADALKMKLDCPSDNMTD
jgi:hypothetical protein